jgi:hypothetical protein
MAITVPYHAMTSALFYDTVQIVSNTNKRDVSDMLDLWVHERTPFLNYLSWGPESGGTQIEWIAEHQGRGYLITGTEITESALIEVAITTSDCGDARNAISQVCSGAALLGYSSDEATHVIFFMYSCTATASDAAEVSIASEVCATIDVGEKLYILGNWANEGSEPRRDTTAVREVITNNFGILREDFSITGSMEATDMYAVANETRHQLRMKMLRMQFYRERATLFMDATQAAQTARSATAGTMPNGLLYFITTYGTSGAASTAGNTYDKTSRSFTESLLNGMIANLWDAGCKPNVVIGSQTQIRKFTQWDASRVRTTNASHLGGFHVTKYLSEVGFEVDLVPMPDFPTPYVFVLDTNKVKLRAKKGRKLFTEKLGKVGDYTQYQMLSEYSVEVKGGTIGTMGGAFGALT